MTTLDYRPIQHRSPYLWAIACWSPLLVTLLLAGLGQTSLGMHIGLWLRAEFFHDNVRTIFSYVLIVTILLAAGEILAFAAIFKTRRTPTTTRFKISLYLATALYLVLIIKPLHATFTLATRLF